MKIKLTLEYDGTDFDGWQTQPGGRTVQDCLESALARILPEPDIKVTAAGRTDAGVHARGQVVHFITSADISYDRLRWSLNAVLPRSITVKAVETAADNFDARRQAKERTYHYYIWNERYSSPFYERYSWWISRRLDSEAMATAAASLIGEHDFAAFTPEKVKPTVREIKRIEIDLPPDYSGRMVRLTAAADSFLHHQVRLITGTLVEVGLGNMAVERVAGILESKNIRLAGAKAPAKGLILERVEY